MNKPRTVAAMAAELASLEASARYTAAAARALCITLVCLTVVTLGRALGLGSHGLTGLVLLAAHTGVLVGLVATAGLVGWSRHLWHRARAIRPTR